MLLTCSGVRSGRGGRVLVCEPMTDADPIDAEVEARLALVARRYGARLDDEQMADVRRIVRGLVEAARALRAVPLDPADEPYPSFGVLRSEP
jgi:hypothetical protein